MPNPKAIVIGLLALLMSYQPSAAGGAAAIPGMRAAWYCERHPLKCALGTIGVIAGSGIAVAIINKREQDRRLGIGGNGGPPLDNPDPGRPEPPVSEAITLAVAAALSQAESQRFPQATDTISRAIAEIYPNGTTQREVNRIVDIGRDPQRGGALVPHEVATAARLESVIGKPVRRVGPSESGDFVDASGVKYDAMGAGGDRMNLQQFEKSLKLHYLKDGVDKIVIDLSSFSQPMRTSLREMVSRSGPSNASRTIFVE